MASTVPTLLQSPSQEDVGVVHHASDSKLEKSASRDANIDYSAAASFEMTHRRLNPRQIQLLALAGTVGAALFVGIGASLVR